MAEEFVGQILSLEPWEIPADEHAQSRTTEKKTVSICR